ncbi:hypothetical protein AN958_11364 [Leucoagaricus sp. SymC.cos]|nr:hypothetical protein AN958_11364 [Leucoagaricus sp. SymC.cos]
MISSNGHERRPVCLSSTSHPSSPLAFLYLKIPQNAHLQADGEPMDLRLVFTSGHYATSNDPKGEKGEIHLRKRDRDKAVVSLSHKQGWVAVASAFAAAALLSIIDIDPAVDDFIFRTLLFCLGSLAFWSSVYFSFNVFCARKTIVTLALQSESRRPVFWDVWVMISPPAIFAAWEILVTLAIIAWAILRKFNGSLFEIALPEPPLAQLLFRATICSVWAVGVLYFVLSVITTVRSRA